MGITIACPKCQARFEITKDLADQPIRCHRCEHTFRRGDANLHADAIQVGTGRKGAPAAVEDEPMPPSRPHATARPPFPTVPLLILLCGFLFLLLALSGGFNFWMIGHADMRFDNEAIALRMQLDQANQRAIAAEQAAQVQEAKAKREIDDLKKKLDKANMEFRELEHKWGAKGFRDNK
jgi:predicted Zn finger-like uncharacterized protein